MKFFLRYFILVIFLLPIYSCEDNLNENQITTNISSKVSIRNGRLCFPSKNAFKDYMTEYLDASESKLASFFDPLYQHGFYSLRPIVTLENEQMVYNHYIKLRAIEITKNNAGKEGDDYFDYLDDIEDIIGDDVFAAFLNEKGEIQIDDIIYKYTDVGLFFTKEEKMDDLKYFLELRNISEDLKIETAESSKIAIKNEYPDDGITLINPDLSYYKLLYVDTDSGSGGGGGYTPTPSYPNSSDPSYYAFLNTLQYCQPSSGLFGNLFGDNNVCIDHYENRRRVKTKAFNYNYLIVYHMGVKVHHQFRGWTGLWRTEAANEIRLVVEAAQFEYDVNKLLNNALINNSSIEKTYYINNQKILYQPNSMNINGFSYSNLDQSSLPEVFQNAGNGLTFEFFGTGWNWLDSQIQNGIDSSLKASQLNNYFYNGLYNFTKGQLQTALNNFSFAPPSNRTFVAKFPENGKIIVQKSVLNIGYGNGIAQCTFDWGAEFSLNFSDNGEGDWGISGGGPGNQLIRPKNFKVKMVGAALGDSWHGSKFNVDID
jgi:hypothetical protein